MLKVEQVSVRIAARPILNAVSFTLAAGEMVAILGANGAGKSSLLAVLSGEKPPAEGGVWLDELPLAGSSPAELAQRRAVMFQHSPLSFPFTVAEVVTLGQHHAVKGLSDAVDQCLALADVIHLRDRLYPSLSGGEKQRVHFARALLQIRACPPSQTPLLLLDEPTASLDPGHQHSLLHAARQWTKQRGGMTVAVLHDVNLAAGYCDRALLLMNEGLAWDAPLADLPEALLAQAYGIAFDKLAGAGSMAFLPRALA